MKKRNTISLPEEMWDDLQRLTALSPGATLSDVIEAKLREALRPDEETLRKLRQMPNPLANKR